MIIIRLFSLATILALLLGVSAHLSYANEASLTGMKAADFLISQQQVSGRIGNLGTSGWAIQALVANQENPQPALNYLLDQAGKLNLNSATELERTILASIAAGHDPRNFNQVDLVAKLQLLVNSNQLGDPTLLNDDCFGILALLASNFTDQAIVVNSLTYLVNYQLANGSWSWQRVGTGDTNSTAVAIQAIQLATSRGYSHTANLPAAINYLHSAQNADGGFGYLPNQISDAASTSWVVQAILSLGQQPEEWLKDGHNPYDFLISLQSESGGVRWRATEEPDLLTTSYAAMALARQPLPVAILDIPTPGPSQIPLPTLTATPNPSPQPSLSPTPISTPIPTPNSTPSPFSQPDLSPTPSLSQTVSPSPDPSPSASPQASALSSPIPSPAPSPSRSSVISNPAITIASTKPEAVVLAQVESLTIQSSPETAISTPANPVINKELSAGVPAPELGNLSQPIVKGENTVTSLSYLNQLAKMMMVLGIVCITWAVRKLV